MDNVLKTFGILAPLITKYVQVIYKATIQNLGSTNMAVRKNSESVIRAINELIPEKAVLLQATVNMIQYNSNSRIKPAMVD